MAKKAKRDPVADALAAVNEMHPGPKRWIDRLAGEVREDVLDICNAYAEGKFPDGGTAQLARHIVDAYPVGVNAKTVSQYLASLK